MDFPHSIYKHEVIPPGWQRNTVMRRFWDVLLQGMEREEYYDMLRLGQEFNR